MKPLFAIIEGTEEETVQRMLQKNMSIELIREITGLTIEKIEMIQKKTGL
jgi:hypothetical protein